MRRKGEKETLLLRVFFCIEHDHHSIVRNVSGCPAAVQISVSRCRRVGAWTGPVPSWAPLAGFPSQRVTDWPRCDCYYVDR